MRRFARRLRFSSSAPLCVCLFGSDLIRPVARSKEEAIRLDPGEYYSAGTAWQPMEPLTSSANGVKKEGKSSVFAYRHPEARVQITGGSPLFCYKFSEAASGSASFQNVVIARLDQKKDHRELETPVGCLSAFRSSSWG